MDEIKLCSIPERERETKTEDRNSRTLFFELSWYCQFTF